MLRGGRLLNLLIRHTGNKNSSRLDITVAKATRDYAEI
jgi:hypothetical protein